MPSLNEQAVQRRRRSYYIAIGGVFFAFAVVMALNPNSVPVPELSAVFVAALAVWLTAEWWKRRHELVEEKLKIERWNRLERVSVVCSLMGFAFYVMSEPKTLHWLIIFVLGTSFEAVAQYQNGRWIRKAPPPAQPTVRTRGRTVVMEQLKPKDK
ncbi:MAG: hypothetical protein SOR89_01770 [Ndongobacter sp.]|nr:hypothetical protein [Ndongobacter sp.]